MSLRGGTTKQSHRVLVQYACDEIARAITRNDIFLFQFVIDEHIFKHWYRTIYHRPDGIIILGYA